jgi:hypothetical protein
MADARLRPPSQLRPQVAQDRSVRPAGRRWWAWVAGAGGAVLMFAVFLRISDSFPLDSDAANNALQAWEMLHGNLLLHGWIIGDATYYLTELPLYGVVEAFFGLSPVVPHVVSALVYVIVAGSAMAVARTGSRGAAAWVRCAVVLAVLAAPFLSAPGVSIAVEKPDHTGTAAIMLACFFLIDRAAGWRFMPLLLGAVLVVGQISDATVLYVGVPAIAVVCLYRIRIAANPASGRRSEDKPPRWHRLRGWKIRRAWTVRRPAWNIRPAWKNRTAWKTRTASKIRTVWKTRTADMAILAAAVVSVPVADLIRAGLVHLGGYWMIAPQEGLAFSQIPHNAALTWRALRILFGAYSEQGTPLATGQVHSASVLGIAGMVFGYACMLAAAYGFARVIRTWRTASRAEQLLCVAIVVNIAAYLFSTIPVGSNAREIIAVVPFGAVLAARALIPERLAAGLRARVTIAAAAGAAVLPLAAAASLPAATPTAAPLAAWLQAHGLRYGVAGYWNASSVTLLSGNKVQVRAVSPSLTGVGAKDWETKAFWYDPTRHYANFAIASMNNVQSNNALPVAFFESFFGKPASIHRVAGRMIMIYQKNVLNSVEQPLTLIGPSPPSLPAVPPNAPGHGTAFVAPDN